jgi:hypothetical protein
VVVVRDQTDTDLINLRRTIYLTVMSSVSSEEAGHKLLSVVRPGQERELCAMLVECCRKEKAYTSYYGQLGQRLCAIDRAYQADFMGHYAATHRMTPDELRASARFYEHLMAADALLWHDALGRIRVTEQDMTSSSRIFIKLLFEDLAEKLGVWTLSKKMNDDNADVRDVLFPRDCARNTWFTINFFTAISLGGVTESRASSLCEDYCSVLTFWLCAVFVIKCLNVNEAQEIEHMFERMRINDCFIDLDYFTQVGKRYEEHASLPNVTSVCITTTVVNYMMRSPMLIWILTLCFDQIQSTVDLDLNTIS